MTPKKIPMRRCLGCMESKPKKELIRVVRSSEGELSVDFTGKKNGRGAYICRDVGCFQKAVKAKRFEHAFSCQIPEEIVERLRQELEDGQ